MANTTETTGATINFKTNCFICLQPEEPTKMLEILQRNSKNLQTFQPILHYLTGTDPTFDKSQEECRLKDLPSIKNMPPLCSKCYEATADIYRLHAELLERQLLIQSKTEEVRKVVMATRCHRGSIPGTGKSSRILFLERLQQSGMPKKQLEVIRTFVDNFHKHVAAQGVNKVIFPSYPPPNFLPHPKPQTAPLLLLQIPVQQPQQPSTYAYVSNGISSVISTASTLTTALTNNVKVPIPVVVTTTDPNVWAPSLVKNIIYTNSSMASSASIPNTHAKTIKAISIIANKTNQSSIIVKRQHELKPLSVPTIKGDVVIIPGTSATLNYENEFQDEQTEHNEFSPLAQLTPEITIKEENPYDNVTVILPDDDPLEEEMDLAEPKDDNDKDWELDDDEETGDSSEEDCDTYHKKLNRKGSPAILLSSKRRQAELSVNNISTDVIMEATLPKQPTAPRKSCHSTSSSAETRKRKLDLLANDVEAATKVHKETQFKQIPS